MEIKNSSATIYVAKDGREFLDKKECEIYENETLKVLENTKYFKYFTNRDLTETGYFTNYNYAAVYIKGWSNCYQEVLLQYLFDRYKGKILSVDVQGYGVTSNFEIKEITKEEYFEKKQRNWGGMLTTSQQILLSEIPIKGFPENIPIISKVLPNYK